MTNQFLNPEYSIAGLLLFVLWHHCHPTVVATSAIVTLHLERLYCFCGFRVISLLYVLCRGFLVLHTSIILILQEFDLSWLQHTSLTNSQHFSAEFLIVVIPQHSPKT